MNIFRKKARTGAAILSAAALLAGIFAGVPRGVTVANAADTADTAGTGSAVVYAGDSANDTTDQIITGDMQVLTNLCRKRSLTEPDMSRMHLLRHLKLNQ